MMQDRWIEYTYKILKQRLQIENYTAYSKIGIKQGHILHILQYTTSFCYSKIYLNKIINRVNEKKMKNGTHYEIDQWNLISRIKEDFIWDNTQPNKRKHSPLHEKHYQQMYSLA